MRKPEKLLLIITLILSGCGSTVEVPNSGKWKEPDIEWSPQGYLCGKSINPPEIDGRLAHGEWDNALWTNWFSDIRGPSAATPRFKTRAKMMWDEDFFYVAADLRDPHVWATLTLRDSVIFEDNDFEVFIDPDQDTHDYFELEINALGTVWDLMLIKPYRDGGPAVHAWDMDGLRTAVQVEGTLNDGGDVDQGWTVEIAFPWEDLKEASGVSCPPEPGDRWRVNFSRVQWKVIHAEGRYVKVTDAETDEVLPEDNWVWSPQGLVNMHYPEMWGIVEFIDDELPGRVPLEFLQSEDWARWELRKVYYREHAWRKANGQFTMDWTSLDVKAAPPVGWSWPPRIRAGRFGFEATLTHKSGRNLVLHEDGRIGFEQP